MCGWIKSSITAIRPWYIEYSSILHRPSLCIDLLQYSTSLATVWWLHQHFRPLSAWHYAICFHKMAQGVIGRERRELDFAEFIALVYLGGSWECFDGVTPSQTLHRP
jgi:hypothetical protein